jgi:ribosomal protein S15P/S13E
LPVQGFRFQAVLPRHEVGKKPVQVAPAWKKAQKPKKHLLKNRQAAAAEANLQVRSHW